MNCQDVPDLSDQLRSLFKTMCDDSGLKGPEDMERLMRGVEITCAIQDKPKLMEKMSAILQFVVKEHRSDAMEAILELVYAVISEVEKDDSDSDV